MLLVAVAVRVAYHARYLGEDPFALVPISDGRIYVTMAADILRDPPWGSEPFYLQGAYGAFLAVGIALGDAPSWAIVLQLAVMALAWWGFFCAIEVVADRRTAAVATAILLCVPALRFYENKYLTAALACASFVAVLGALAAVIRKPTLARIALAGAAAGLAILLRGNVVLALPWCAWAIVAFVREREGAPTWPRALAAWTLGLCVVLVPMAVRNAAVTGDATVMPAHGGGTSFYIGNNAHARGVWNDAGGLLSGDVVHEPVELASRLGVDARGDAERAREIGRALYLRALEEIAAEPGRFAWLLLRKAWLLAGDDELTQDYDVLGEEELVGRAFSFGVSFGVLLAISAAAWVGARGRSRDAVGRAWTRTCVGLCVCVVAANLLFFTSAQHRLPLVVPLLAWVAWARTDLAFRDGDRTRRVAMIAAAIAVLVFAMVPARSRQTEPSAVHDFNLALAQMKLGEPRAALASLDRAVARRPEHPVIRIERATLARQLGDLATARDDLAVIEHLPDVPSWVRVRVAEETRAVGAASREPPRATEMAPY